MVYGAPLLPRRVKTFVLLSALFALFGFINLFAPVELVGHSVSSKLRLHAVETDIVILEIDAKLDAELGEFPWEDAAMASLVDTLSDAGPQTVVFVDPLYLGKSEQPALVQSLSENSGRFYVAPTEAFLKQPDLVDQNLSYLVVANYLNRYWGGVEHGKTGVMVGNNLVPSAEFRLAKGEAPTNTSRFLIDYGIDRKSVEAANLRELLAADSLTDTIRGRRVIVSRSLDISPTSHLLLTQGTAPISEVTALAALSIEKRPIIDLGFLPALLAAMLLSGLILQRSCSQKMVALGFVCIPALVITQLVVEAFGLRLNVMSGTLLLLGVAVFGWIRVKRREEALVMFTHWTTALPSSRCISAQQCTDNRALVCAVVANYTSVCSSLTVDQERMLANNIAAVFSQRGHVYQGDLGQFFWFEDDTSNNLSELISVLERLCDQLDAGVEIDGRTHVLRIALGFDTRYSQPLAKRTKTSEETAHSAYHQKLFFCVHDDAAEDALSWRSRILYEIDHGIKDNDIRIHIQPKFRLLDGKMTGGEALARWFHPELGPLSPAEFISAAEDGRRIEDLTRHVIRHGFRFLSDAVKLDPDFELAINISPKLITDPAFEFMLVAAIATYKVDPKNVVLEITENIELLVDHAAMSAMLKLKSMGFRFSIDDYGTGLSTLQYLKTIPAEELKIDRSFMLGLAGHSANIMLVESTIKLGQRLGMSIVAEGVEDEQTLNLLHDLGCDSVQGYFMSPPLEPAEVLEMCKRAQSLPQVCSKG